MVKNFTDLTGRKAIVTGAAQGLSRGMAEGLMEAGAEVAIIDLNPKVMEVAAEYVEKRIQLPWRNRKPCKCG